MSQKIEKYTALVMQPEVNVARTRDDINKNLERCCQMIDFGTGYFYERPVRLVVFPEYFLQGVTTPGKGEDSLKEFMNKAITIPGPELDVLVALALVAKAERHDIRMLLSCPEGSAGSMMTVTREYSFPAIHSIPCIPSTRPLSWSEQSIGQLE